MIQLVSRLWALYRHNQWLCIALPSLFVVIFCAKYIVTGGNFKGGDFDYYASAYEAFRSSIFSYHEFPFWNPWAAGGVPLFANPQFGLISIQSLLVVLFGTVVGLKLSFVVYSLIGFWGIYMTTRSIFKASYVRACSLGFIWIACGFFSYHDIDHITFLLFHALPWLFLIFVKRNEYKRSWLWFGGIYGLLILTSPHYALLMTALFLVMYFVISKALDYWRTGELALKKDLSFLWKSAAVIIVLSGYRLAMTLQFLQGANRDTSIFQEPANSIGLLLTALFVPVESLDALPQTFWRWHEYSMFMGTGITILVIAITILGVHTLAKRKPSVSRIVATPKRRIAVSLGLTAIICFLLALGDHGSFSLFHLLRQLPGFEETRVPSRWLILVVFVLICFIASIKLPSRKQQFAVTALVILSAVELFATYFSLHGAFRSQVPQQAHHKQSFSQRYANQHPGRDMNFTDYRDSYYYSTTQNTGIINFDDSLINTIAMRTERCANNTDPDCAFVRTSNAKLVSWSPNKIVLKRIGDGQIVLNMNPGNYWLVNNQRIFAHMGAAEPQQEFRITNPDQWLVIEAVPKLSPQYILQKIL